MLNPFDILQQEIAQVMQQNLLILQQLQLLTAKGNEDLYLTVDETRKQWHPAVSRQTIYTWEQKGLLKRHEINGKPYFLKSEVMLACRTIQRYKTKG